MGLITCFCFVFYVLDFDFVVICFKLILIRFVMGIYVLDLDISTVNILIHVRFVSKSVWFSVN